MCSWATVNLPSCQPFPTSRMNGSTTSCTISRDERTADSFPSFRSTDWRS